MDEQNRQALADSILDTFEAMKTLKPGTEAHTAAVNAVTKLYQTGLEDIKQDNESEEMMDRLEREVKNQKDQKLDRYIRYGIDILGITLPMVFYATWMRRGFEFEREGTYTSNTFKNLFNKFRPTK